MIFDKINKIEAENKFLLERNHYLELAVENLKKENETLIKNFTKQFKYVIISDSALLTKIYQDGEELKRVKSVKFEHNIYEEGPEMEVVLR
jgi:hypothetical protein